MGFPRGCPAPDPLPAARGPCTGQAGQGGAQQHPEPPQAQDAVAGGAAGDQGQGAAPGHRDPQPDIRTRDGLQGQRHRGERGAGGAGAALGPTRDPPQPPQSLATDLEEAEEQHAQALRSHLHNVDRLLQLQRSRLTCLEEGYSTQLEALKTEFEAERYRGGEGQQWHPPAGLAWC